MAFGHGKDTKVFINGYDLTTYFRSHSSAENVDMAETSTFGTQAKTYLAGMRDATLSLEGLYDGAVDAVDAVLAAALNQNNQIFVVMPQGDALGSPGFGFSAQESSYEVDGDVGDIVSIAVEAQSNVGRERILSHHPMGQEVAGGNGQSIDNGQQTTNGAVAYLVVPDITGITNLAVKFQDSSNLSDWADITGAAFSGVTADRAKQRITISGTIRRYTRAVWTFTGAGSATFFCGLGRL